MPRVAWPSAPEENDEIATLQEPTLPDNQQPISPSAIAAITQESAPAEGADMADGKREVDPDAPAPICPAFCACANCKPAFISFASFAELNDSTEIGFGGGALATASAALGEPSPPSPKGFGGALATASAALGGPVTTHDEPSPPSPTGSGRALATASAALGAPVTTHDEPSAPTERDPPSPKDHKHRKRIDTTDEQARRSQRLRIKTEAMRSQPWRNGRHKAGFYNEQNLITLAWRGTGTKADPLLLF